MTTYRTCKHAHDTGRTCASAAVTGHDYCAFHLHHRARLMRLAQYRARKQRLLLQLPPLEDMYSVQSALNQLSEAAAAGMIDLKQARFLLSVVRTAGQFLLRADKWQAAPYHSDQSCAPEPALSLSKGSPIIGANPGTAEIDLAAQYGLSPDLDLSRLPEEAYPPTPDLSSRAERSAVEGPAFSGHQPLATDHSLPELPFSGNYCGDHHSRECECCRIRPDYPVTPESVEVVEVYEKFGDKVAAARGRQLERNRQLRQLRNERKRYQAVALEHNMRRAAELMTERKLADRAKPQESTNHNSEFGCPTPTSVGGAGPSSPDQKKPVASAKSCADPAVAAPKSSA